MKNEYFCWTHAWVVLLLPLQLVCPVVATRGEDTAGTGEILRQAIQADLAGRSEDREAALALAVAVAPNCELARWLGGQVHDGEQWTSLDALQDQNKKHGWIEEYRRLRDMHADNLQGHYLLAQYCRRHGLKDRERLHWYAILLAAPGHKEAIRSLGLRLYRGTLLTNDQIQWLKDTEAQWNEAKSKWEPELAEIRKSILEGTPEERQLAIERLAAIDDPTVVPFAEQAFAGETEDLALQLVALAGRMNDQVSTNLLARYAVYADSDAVREQAIEHLKGRDWFTFVPMLMGAMAAPVNMSFSATPVAAGMIAVISLRREGPTADYEQQLRISSMAANRNVDARRNPRSAANVAAARTRAAMSAAQAGARAYRQTIEENRRVQYWNGRIDMVLSEVTGHETDGRAESWWQWWQEYNDLYVPDEKPVYRAENEIRVGTCECFLPGTPVWTETGPVSIERIRVGDRVLSQAPDTGELAYKLVLQTTIRPEAATVRVGIEGEEICATNGHPFWVAGEGWKMAKNLEPGLRLHTVGGSREITHIEEGPKLEAHNLLVADFQSFFVGNAKVLVHDNSIRQPTAAIVPGVTAEQAGVAPRKKALSPASKQLSAPTPPVR